MSHPGPDRTQTPLARARALAPLIEERAQQAQDERTLPADVVDALAAAGLFRMCLPAELGGEDPSFTSIIETWEEIARADGSTGWTLMANASAAAAAGAYLADDAVRKVFADDPSRTVGGQFAPKGVGTPEADGFRVSGSYNFGSGTGHSAYVGLGFIPFDDGQPRMAESGLPDMRAAFVPREQVEFTDGWFVMGLQGTGSYDYNVQDVLIPEEYSFGLFCREPKRGGARFTLGLMPITAAGHASWALGVGRRALDEVVSMAQSKQRMGHATALAGRLTFQTGYAHHEAQLRAARLLVLDSFETALEGALRGDPLTGQVRAWTRNAANFATVAAKQAVEFAHEYAGTDAIRDGSALQRCYRDIHTGSQHAFINEKVYADSAQILLGNAEDVPGL